MFDHVKNVSIMLHYAGCSGSSHDRDHKCVTAVVVHKFVVFMYLTLNDKCETQQLS